MPTSIEPRDGARVVHRELYLAERDDDGVVGESFFKYEGPVLSDADEAGYGERRE